MVTENEFSLPVPLHPAESLCKSKAHPYPWVRPDYAFPVIHIGGVILSNRKLTASDAGIIFSCTYEETLLLDRHDLIKVGNKQKFYFGTDITPKKFERHKRNVNRR